MYIYTLELHCSSAQVSNISDMEFSEVALEKDLNNMRKYYGSGKTKEASWRKSQLDGLRNFIIENEENILKALKKDLGKHHVEAFRDEVCLVHIPCCHCNFYIKS